MDGVIFREEQRFRQTWLWLLVLLPLVVVIPFVLFGLHQQLVLGKPFGSSPVNDSSLVRITILVLAIPLLIVALSWWAALEVIVTRELLSVRFRPFHLSPRVFSLRDIRTCEPRQYEPITEYGGWGIRGCGGDRAYNVSGDRGVQLEFRDGQRLLIGSKRSDELAAAIRAGMNA